MLATSVPAGILVKLTACLIIILTDLIDLPDELGSLLITRNGLGHFNIILGHTGGFIIQVKETIVDTELYNISACICICRLVVSYQGVLLAGNVGDIHVVGGWGKIFQLLPGEDVFSDEMDLCVSMLSGLGGRHISDLARTVLDENMSTLPQGRALHGERQRRTRIGRVDGVILL